MIYSLVAGFLLFSMLLFAGRCDLRMRRIPNRLTLAGLSAGLLTAGAQEGWAGLGGALLGVAGGFAVLFPLYMLRAMGAGDVKLMAAAGAYLGAPLVFSGALFSVAAGVLLVLVVAGRPRAVGQVAANTGNLLSFWVHSGGIRRADWLTLDSPTAIKVPYGVAIAFGCAFAAFFPDLLVF